MSVRPVRCVNRVVRAHPGRVLGAVLSALLASCGQVPLTPPATLTPAAATSPKPPVPDGSAWQKSPRTRWVPAQWSDLPGWTLDDVQAAWPPLWKSCAKPSPAQSPEWQPVCQRIKALGPQWAQDVGSDLSRQWLESQLRPWRVASNDGSTTGLLTGYFEPLVDGSRQRDTRFTTPLHRAPADLGLRKPHLTRSELETTAAGQSALAGRELVYLADPLDALLVQVQGSTRVRLVDERLPNGDNKVIRLAFGGHNDQPYASVARWLVDQGAFPLEQASWPAIKAWAAQNPQRVPEMLRANPRMVFFREEALPNPGVGPVGAQGIALTPGRSIAVDRDSVPLGTPVWLDSTVPQAWSPLPAPAQPLRRLVVAQDTGGAIVGSVRADFFWGWGDDALLQAGRTKQPLQLWVLWPAGTAARDIASSAPR